MGAGRERNGEIVGKSRDLGQFGHVDPSPLFFLLLTRDLFALVSSS